MLHAGAELLELLTELLLPAQCALTIASWFAHPRLIRGGLLLVDVPTSASCESMPRPVVTANRSRPPSRSPPGSPCCAARASQAEAAPHRATGAQKPQMQLRASLAPSSVQ